MFRFRDIRFVSAVVATVALSPCSAFAQYTIVDLGTLAGPDATTAPGAGGMGINNNGVITGFSIASDVNRDIRAFRWMSGAMAELPPTAGAVHSHGLALNDSGVAVGASYTLGELAPMATRWTGGMPELLGPFVARDINGGGVIVGERALSPYYAETVAVVWDAGVLTDLPTLGGSGAGAYAVDAAGHVAGMSLLADETTYRACLWVDGVAHDLGTLGGARSQAVDLNDIGQVVGHAQTSSGALHAFVFVVDAGGSVTSRTDLGTLNDTFSYAFGVNAVGQIVGSSDSRATLWDGSGIHDLNLMIPAGSGWELMKATAINDNGQIIGHGKHFGLPRSFLLTPAWTGDLNGDGAVDVFDLFALLNAWGPCSECPADLNGDGVVDVFDLFELLANWG